MRAQFSSITLSTYQLQNMLNFYSALGILFTESKVDKGSKINKASVSGLEFALYERASGNAKDSALNTPQASLALQLSFQVKDIENLIDRLKTLDGVQVLLEPQQMQDCKKAVVLDPDGHAIELLQN